MKVYIPFQQDRAMIAFVNTKGVVYLPEGKRLPGIPRNKRIVVPLYSVEEIAARSPGLIQEIEEYSIIASAASEAEKIYRSFRAYLIRKSCSTLGIVVSRGKNWESELAQNMINASLSRVRVFAEGYADNVFVVSAVAGQNKPESVRKGGGRVMFIRTSPSTTKTADFRKFARGWGVYIPEKLSSGELSAVRCPPRFVQEYESAYLEHKRLERRREEKYRAITQAYLDLGEMAVKTERGFFVMYKVSPTVVAAHYQLPSIRVMVALKEQEKEETSQ